MNCILYIIPLSWKKENVVRQIYKNLKLDIDISILQSVSIKTIGGYNTNTMKKTFMLHFASINTLRHSHATNMLRKFTIHFATINTKLTINETWAKEIFTIHFATINTISLIFTAGL